MKILKDPRRRRRYKLKNGELELVRSLGRRGGKRNTPEQQRARLVNIYRALSKRHPTSAVIAAKLKQLEAGRL